jgi:thiol-disulfide isomerase/thioredoxin
MKSNPVCALPVALTILMAMSVFGCSSGDGSVSVILQPMVPGDSLSLKWSPKGEKLPLTAAANELQAELKLGPVNLPVIKLILSTSEGALYPDKLLGDWNHNGSLTDDSILSTVPKETRGKFWSSFSASVDILVTDPSTGKTVTNPYPLDFWYVFDPQEPNADKVMRYSRRGWMQGTFETDSVRGSVMLCEMEMNGMYDSLDSWALALPANLKELYGPGARPCTDHCWLGEQAYRIGPIDLSGRLVKLTPFNPGMTRQEEEAARDLMAVDRRAPHSGKQVNFLHDFEKAYDLASKEKKAMLLDFETTWCGPCKMMDQWVYNADAVVEKSHVLVAVKVDGDRRRDLVKKYQVGAYPTIILIGTDGNELKRVVGYQSVEQMTAFLSIPALN